MPQARSNLRTSLSAAALDLDAMRGRSDEAAQLLKALGNGQRLRILCVLVEGERSVGEINQRIALSPSALSQHLARLREEGLVTTRREAQTIFYSLADGPVRQIIQTLYGIYCGTATRAPRRNARRR